MLPAFVAFSYCKRWDWEWGSFQCMCVGGARGVTFFSLEELLAYCWKLTAKLAPKNGHLILVLQVPWRWLFMCDMERGMGKGGKSTGAEGEWKEERRGEVLVAMYYQLLWSCYAPVSKFPECFQQLVVEWCYHCCCLHWEGGPQLSHWAMEWTTLEMRAGRRKSNFHAVTTRSNCLSIPRPTVCLFLLGSKVHTNLKPRPLHPDPLQRGLGSRLCPYRQWYEQDRKCFIAY